MIDFTRAISSAWERTRIILFEPWDPAKWFVIGFNSFLALLAEGGVAINNSIPFQNQSQGYRTTYQSLPAFLHALKQSVAWLNSLATNPWVWLIGLGAFLGLLIWLALNWVGCRGEFMFLDNIVRNRPAIAEPWRRYARQGNTWFFVHVGLTLLSIGLLVLSAGVFLALDWSWISGERSPSGPELTIVSLFFLAFVLVWIVYTAVTFLIHTLVIPLYFKQTMGLGAAFATVGRLVFTHFLSILIYLLLSFALILAGGIVALTILTVSCCLVCWLACIPCLGSMALSFVLCQLILPVSIFLRCFQLDCLAQFGPECDVWSVDVAPLNPPPPRG